MGGPLGRLIRTINVALFGHACEDCGTTLLACGKHMPNTYYCMECGVNREIEP